jgi:hypothetical protein
MCDPAASTFIVYFPQDCFFTVVFVESLNVLEAKNEANRIESEAFKYFTGRKRGKKRMPLYIRWFK